MRMGSEQAVYKERKAAYNERQELMDHPYEQKTGRGRLRMQQSSPSRLPGRPADQPGVGGTRLHGRWLVLARIVWLALVSFVLILFVISLPGYVVHLSTRRNNI